MRIEEATRADNPEADVLLQRNARFQSGGRNKLLEAEGEPLAKRLRIEATEAPPPKVWQPLRLQRRPPSQSSYVQYPNVFASLVLHEFAELRAEGGRLCGHRGRCCGTSMPPARAS